MPGNKMVSGIKGYLISGLVLLALGYGLGRYLQSPKEITKIQEVEKEVIKKDIVIVTKEVKHPDGTVETTTTSTDNSTEVINKNKDVFISKNTEKQWFISAGYGRGSALGDTIITASVNRRMIGPYFLGASGTFNTIKNDHTVGINIGMEF